MVFTLMVTSRSVLGAASRLGWDGTQLKLRGGRSLGLIPCTNSRTFPRAGSGLLVTGLGGAGHLAAAFWCHYFPPLH